MTDNKNKVGRPKVDAPKQKVTIRVEPKMIAKLKAEATTEGVSFSKHLNNKLK